MGFLGRIKERRSHPSVATQMMLKAFGLLGGETASGMQVSEELALQLSAVYGCVKILAESRASLPLMVYERLPDGGRRPAVRHPLYPLLHDQPNPEMSSFTLREMGQAYLCLWGNEFNELVFNGAGRLAEIWPLRADRMKVERKDGKLVYIYRKVSGEEVVLPPERVLHIPDMTLDGVVGISRIRQAAESVGLSLAAEQFGARFFKNGAVASGIAEYDKALDDQQFERFKKSFREAYQGVQNSHGVIFMEDGAKFHQLTIPPEDAQYLDTRRFQVAEIARLYRVPLHLLQETEKSTSWGTGIEQMTMGFVVYTLRPWLVRVEQVYNNKLLRPEEREKFFIEHKVDGLLRGDFKTRTEGYNKGIYSTWMVPNDARRLENLPPLPGLDEPLIPANMVPLSMAGQNGRAARLSRAAAERVARKEVAALERAISDHHGDPEAVRSWAAEFFLGDHLRWAAEVMAVHHEELRAVMGQAAESMGPLELRARTQALVEAIQ